MMKSVIFHSLLSRQVLIVVFLIGVTMMETAPTPQNKRAKVNQFFFPMLSFLIFVYFHDLFWQMIRLILIDRAFAPVNHSHFTVEAQGDSW